MNAGRTHGLGALGAALLACVASAPARAAAVPAWLTEAAAVAQPSCGPDVSAVVVLHEVVLTVAPNGKTRETRRGVVRILTRAGRDFAACVADYTTGGERVADMRAWLLPAAGPVRAFGRKDCVDTKRAENDVYDEHRRRLISVAAQAAPGAVFGYEWTIEGRSVFMQYVWSPANDVPTQTARLALRLPSEWHVAANLLNHAPIEPETGAGEWIWELRDLPATPDEPAAPPAYTRAPRLMLRFEPEHPAGSASETAFRSWDQVSRWIASLSDPQAALDDVLRARAATLVAGTPRGIDRIRRIGTFVQGLNYISIQTDIAKGGGYRPHAAREVLDKGYGDCKDKANLMRALLAAIDVPSWLVLLYSRDPAWVREDWPSPWSFDHCIVAFRAPTTEPSAACLEDEALGPLCLFDPTDPHTPLGALPRADEGGLALVVSAEGGGLLRVPLTPPESSMVRRAVVARLEATGAVAATVHVTSTGAMASRERAAQYDATEREYRLRIDDWLGRSVPGAVVGDIAPTDDRSANRFDLEVAFTAPRWGRRLSDSLFALRPALGDDRGALDFPDVARTLPIVLRGRHEEETVAVVLPSSFSVEDFPEAASLDTPIGSYQSDYAFRDGRLQATRALVIHEQTLPPERYPEVVAFFRAVRRAEAGMVVLRVTP